MMNYGESLRMAHLMVWLVSYRRKILMSGGQISIWCLRGRNYVKGICNLYRAIKLILDSSIQSRLYVMFSQIFILRMKYIDYTDPYDIEYACFMLAKPPPIPQVS